jgi:hemerythrin-like domain-containing protein
MNAMPAATRPARPPVPPLPDFSTLDHTHREALKMLQALDRLLVQLRQSGPDDAARAAALDIMAFFNGPARGHHAEEETRVFPELLALGDAELTQQVLRLKQDHGWLDQDWRELSPHIEAIASGYTWYDLDMLFAALPIFNTLYEEHIALEETVVYPEARRRRAMALAAEAQRAGSD